HENASGRGGVKKGDAFPIGAGARHVVDELDARAPAAVEGRVQVIDGEADVMNAGTAFGDELADRRVGLFGFEQLHERVSRTHGGDAGAVGVVEGLLRKSQQVTIEWKHAIERLDGDADVRDPGTTLLHASCSY